MRLRVTAAMIASLSFRDWRMLLLALVALPLIDVSLRMRGYVATRRSMRFAAVAHHDSDVDESSLALARLVSIAARRSPWRCSCLRQALLLEWLLARRGVASSLRIGVRCDSADGFRAHAWVERGGIILIGGEHSSTNFETLV